LSRIINFLLVGRRKGKMATSTFDTKFVIKDPEAIKNLEKAMGKRKKYVPKHNIDEAIDDGVKKLKHSLSHSK